MPRTKEMQTESDYDHDVDLGDLSLTYGKIARHVPAGARVLDIGCATGSFGLALQAERSCQVTGLEVDSKAAAKARSRGLEVIEADVQAASLLGILGERRFDAIILADVLEHLVHPQALLEQLPGVLAPGGRVLVSVPNITHVDIQLMLAQDDWRYRSSGLLDQTHLRFFSLGTFSAMAFASGFDVASVERVVVPCLGTEVLDFGKGLTLAAEQFEALRTAVESSNDNASTYQHVLVLEPAQERMTRAAGVEALEVSGPRAPSSPADRPVVDIVVATEVGRAELTAILLRSLRLQTLQDFAVTVVLRGADEAALREYEAQLGRAVAAAVSWQLVAGGPTRGAALNAGLDLATHEYLAFWTDDDAPADTFLAQLVELLESHPGLSAGYGSCRIAQGELGHGVWRDLGEVGSLAAPFDRMRMVSGEAVALSSTLVRVADLRRSALRFDELPGGYPEWTFLASLAASHEMAVRASAVMTSWVHPGRQAPVPGQADEQHRRLLAIAAQRDGPLPVRARREEIRLMMTERDRLAGELDALREDSQRELLGVRGELDRVLGSRSWKLTRVLRRLTHSRLPG